MLMNTKQISAEELDRLFDEGEEDVIQYFDLSKARRPGLEQQKISISLPNWMVDSLDREAERVGVTRQAVIKLWLDERLKSQSA
jgi:hypothetical protein